MIQSIEHGTPSAEPCRWHWLSDDGDRPDPEKTPVRIPPEKPEAPPVRKPTERPGDAPMPEIPPVEQPREVPPDAPEIIPPSDNVS